MGGFVFDAGGAKTSTGSIVPLFHRGPARRGTKSRDIGWESKHSSSQTSTEYSKEPRRPTIDQQRDTAVQGDIVGFLRKKAPPPLTRLSTQSNIEGKRSPRFMGFSLSKPKSLGKLCRSSSSPSPSQPTHTRNRRRLTRPNSRVDSSKGSKVRNQPSNDGHGMNGSYLPTYQVEITSNNDKEREIHPALRRRNRSSHANSPHLGSSGTEAAPSSDTRNFAERVRPYQEGLPVSEPSVTLAEHSKPPGKLRNPRAFNMRSARSESLPDNQDLKSQSKRTAAGQQTSMNVETEIEHRGFPDQRAVGQAPNGTTNKKLLSHTRGTTSRDHLPKRETNGRIHSIPNGPRPQMVKDPANGTGKNGYNTISISGTLHEESIPQMTHSQPVPLGAEEHKLPHESKVTLCNDGSVYHGSPVVATQVSVEQYTNGHKASSSGDDIFQWRRQKRPQGLRVHRATKGSTLDFEEHGVPHMAALPRTSTFREYEIPIAYDVSELDDVVELPPVEPPHRPDLPPRSLARGQQMPPAGGFQPSTPPRDVGRDFTGVVTMAECHPLNHKPTSSVGPKVPDRPHRTTYRSQATQCQSADLSAETHSHVLVAKSDLQDLKQLIQTYLVELEDRTRLLEETLSGPAPRYTTPPKTPRAPATMPQQTPGALFDVPKSSIPRIDTPASSLRSGFAGLEPAIEFALKNL